ncbi:hypothetical protein [uncultured Sphingomonas sp.]|uniref:hypothetical protein n=1 Tax=uncultured Sphingomonas sp. TaxID=158754 RepID=UPI0025E3176D|nr:hypothetical protein [uncultured Sphingomonas sp.]
MAQVRGLPGEDHKLSPLTLALRSELAGGMRRLGGFQLAHLALEICNGRDSLWLIVRVKGAGGYAIRTAHVPGGGHRVRKLRPRSGERCRFEVQGPAGRYEVRIRGEVEERPMLRATVELTPTADLLVPYLPRDLYPIGADDDPVSAQGHVEAAQRGLNSGLLFLRREEPDLGELLYFQNLTALNDYHNATGTKPDGAVGGEWPELGYLPPSPPQSGTPPINPLPAGRTVTLSDALLVFGTRAWTDECDSAQSFLQMQVQLYGRIDKPEPQWRDWPARAERTVRDLQHSRKATIRHYRHTYIHPYTASEYPDSMVQLSVLAALRAWERWTGEPLPFADELAKGVPKFFDESLGTLRRYLPNAKGDKDMDAVDSWYLYHPLLNLGRLAEFGDAAARDLFFRALGHTIDAAHHFRYVWPIKYDLRSFAVITPARDDGGLGQTDVGGIYAYVMLQAFELSSERRYLDEARAALDATRGMRFNLNYQANLTAWGAAACMRLWRLTNDATYLRQSYVFVASFFHNAAMWESNLKAAAHYPNFLGVTALHDGPYMAIYECFDSFSAFERYLRDAGAELDQSVRLLLCEYCRYALDRAWFYYPDALPEHAIAEEVRNGHVDHTLSFPLEDLYRDGQPAGQVGQEIYGCGAAPTFAVHSSHRLEGAPFLLFCDHFVATLDRTGPTSIALQLIGPGGGTACLSAVWPGKRNERAVHGRVAGREVAPHADTPERTDFIVPADGRVQLAWE